MWMSRYLICLAKFAGSQITFLCVGCAVPIASIDESEAAEP